MQNIIYLLLLILGPAALAAGGPNGCGGELEPLTHQSIAEERLRLKGEDVMVTLNDEFIDHFRRTGWAHIRALARDADTDAGGLLLEAASILDLVHDELDRRLNVGPAQNRMPELIEALVRPTARLLRPLRRNAHVSSDTLRGLALSLRWMAQTVTHVRKAYKLPPRFNPYGPLDEAWVDALVEDLELLSLDYAMHVERMTDVIVDHLGVAEPYVAPPPENHVRPKFAEVLHHDPTTFNADAEYDLSLIEASGESTRDLIVTISEDVIEALTGTQSEHVLRLMRALTGAQTEKKGIRALTYVGPNLIEVKTIMHGHWRIIGCLEGDRLRLISLMDMPESGTSYVKRLSSNYCATH